MKMRYERNEALPCADSDCCGRKLCAKRLVKLLCFISFYVHHSLTHKLLKPISMFSAGHYMHSPPPDQILPPGDSLSGHSSLCIYYHSFCRLSRNGNGIFAIICSFARLSVPRSCCCSVSSQRRRDGGSGSHGVMNKNIGPTLALQDFIPLAFPRCSLSVSLSISIYPLRTTTFC